MAYVPGAGWHTDCELRPMTSDPDEEIDPYTDAVRIEAAMQGIVSYLRLHPDAADSLRGVQLWLRLLPDELGERVVSLALRQLVARGLIGRWNVVGGAVVYGRLRPR